MASTSAVHSRAWPWLVRALIAGALAGAVALAVGRKPARLAASIPPVVAGLKPAAPAADVALPPATDSDARIRDALDGLTPREIFHRWLQTDHLLDHLVVIAVNLAEDQSPARQLSFLRPSRRLSTTRSGGELVISPYSYTRYDAFANVVSSLDERHVATAYRALHPLLESAYHALGYPGRPLDEVVTRALQRIIDAPVREEIALHQAGSLYLFADASLESLGAVEKQLLRMGPRNTQLLQGEARDVGAALGLPLRGEPQAATTR